MIMKRGGLMHMGVQIAAWERHTRGTWEELWLPGGHRYMVEDPGPLLTFLHQDMVRVAAWQRL